MGRQINYYMSFEEFKQLAQFAIDEGILILPREHTLEKLIPADDISIVTEDCCEYYFFTQGFSGTTWNTDIYGHYYVSLDDETRLTVIEAGYSQQTEQRNGKTITRSRLYIPTGYYNDEGDWISRSKSVDKVYNRLVRVVKKISPYTMIEYRRLDREGKPAFGQNKYYISNDCSAWKTEGYEIEDLAYLKKEYEKYLSEKG